MKRAIKFVFRPNRLRFPSNSTSPKINYLKALHFKITATCHFFDLHCTGCSKNSDKENVTQTASEGQTSTTYLPTWMSSMHLPYTIPAAISPLPWITMLGEQIKRKRTSMTIIRLKSENEHKPAATSGPNYLLQTNLPFTLFEALVWWAVLKHFSSYIEHLLTFMRHSLKSRKWSHITQRNLSL